MVYHGWQVKKLVFATVFWDIQKGTKTKDIRKAGVLFFTSKYVWKTGGVLVFIYFILFIYLFFYLGDMFFYL